MHVTLKPELRTTGGETVSIYLDGNWAGDVYLIYRENDMLSGTVQIDTGKVPEHRLDRVLDEVRTYIQHLTSALRIENGSVVLMYGDIERVLEMGPQDIVDDTVEDAPDLTYDPDYQYESEDPDYYLSVVSDEGEHVKYHLHNEHDNVIGVVAVDEIGDTVSGRVDFWVKPDKEETNEVAQLLTREFANDTIENLSFTMNYEDIHVGDMHLERHDMI
jgi:hypothetical protein